MTGGIAAGPRRQQPPLGAPVDRSPASGSPASGEHPLETEYRPRVPIDAARTIRYQQRGAHDPSQLTAAGVIWRATRTPAGVATTAIRVDAGRIRAAAWGPGAAWSLAQLPRLCGADDDPSEFDAGSHPLIAEAHHRHPALRIGATDLLFDALVSSIVEQKVTGLQAFGAWRMILTWCGERAPGPTPRPMFAPPADWAMIPSWTWHRAGLEPPQSRTIVRVAARRPSLERAVAAVSGSGEQTERILTSMPGIGAWTSAETRIRAHGDPDAVSVGDYHLAHEVGFALTGHRATDAGMLELLEPWRGHRQRVIRLLGLSGAREPRRGPRLSPEDHRGR